MIRQKGENLNPNVNTHGSELQKPSHSPASSAKPSKIPIVVVSPQRRIRQRKFLVAKKKKKNKPDAGAAAAVTCTCKASGGDKCVCVAYQNLRVSQEEFFKGKICDEIEDGEVEEAAEVALEEEIEAKLMIHDLGIEERNTVDEEKGDGEEEEEGSATAMVKRRRERVMEEARNSGPESGSGRVMHLVKAFEKLLSIRQQGHDHDEENGKKSKVMKWALPGMKLPQLPDKAPPETEVSGGSGSSSFCCPSELVLTSQNLGLDNRISISSSLDSRRGSVSSRTSSGGRRSRRNSLESSGIVGGTRWKKKQQLRVTSQKPFKLRTEQRGKMKEEEFMKKVHEMLTEEERQRVPVAQGLPWTTDEPESLVKPPVKESTRPIDLKLHSDLRAIDRAEFDHQVAEKMSLLELQKMERERQQKLEEEEEIRRLRKELIPKAQPMPYFDRPFIPRRSMKHPTIPREPKFHIPHHKKLKCYSPWNEMNLYPSSYLN